MNTVTAQDPSSNDETRVTREQRAPPDAAPPVGAIAVRLEKTEGYFIEGFELALRFETAAGEFIEALSWNDFVRSRGESTLRDYYDTVLEQIVPAGEVILFASMEIGDAAPPRAPDPLGELRCRLAVEVPAAGRVEVEVSFAAKDCLHRS